MADNMIERMIFEMHKVLPTSTTLTDDELRLIARYGLRAIREPTAEMLEAGNNQMSYVGCKALYVWRSMHECALNPNARSDAALNEDGND